MYLAKLWGDDIINDKETFANVPTKLKERVAEYLVSKGFSELATETL